MGADVSIDNMVDLSPLVMLALGLEPASHRGPSVMLNQHFVSRGILDRSSARLLGRMQKFREGADFNRCFVFDREGAEPGGDRCWH